jgi:hypothetical protein
MMKKDENDILGKIPNKLTFIGIVICILSIVSLIFAIKVLFY